MIKRRFRSHHDYACFTGKRDRIWGLFNRPIRRRNSSKLSTFGWNRTLDEFRYALERRDLPLHETQPRTFSMAKRKPNPLVDTTILFRFEVRCCQTQTRMEFAWLGNLPEVVSFAFRRLRCREARSLPMRVALATEGIVFTVKVVGQTAMPWYVGDTHGSRSDGVPFCGSIRGTVPHSPGDQHCHRSCSARRRRSASAERPGRDVVRINAARGNPKPTRTIIANSTRHRKHDGYEMRGFDPDVRMDRLEPIDQTSDGVFLHDHGPRVG